MHEPAPRVSALALSLVATLVACGGPSSEPADDEERATAGLEERPTAEPSRPTRRPRYSVSDGTWSWHSVSQYDLRGGHGADGLVLCDLDGDGRDDIVAAWEQGHSITAHYAPANPGGEWRAQEVVHDPRAGFEGVACADLDRDGHADIVAAAQSGSPIPRVFHGDGGTRWREAPLPSPRGNHRWLGATIVDLDGDGRLDVVGLPATRHVLAWYQRADGWEVEEVAQARHVMTLIADDVDGDGDLDLLISQRRESPADDVQPGLWWAEQGTRGGAGGSWTRHDIDASQGPRPSMACRRGDGVIAQTYRDHGQLSLFTRGEDPRARWRETRIPLPVGLGGDRSLKGCSWADLDGDGDEDLAIAARDNRAIWAVLREGDGWRWIHLDPRGWGSKSDEPVAHDMDGDGDLDLLLTEEGRGGPNARGLGWFENPWGRR